MALRFEKTAAGQDLVIDGLEKGIAPSPYAGIADIRNANIISIPGQSAVNFDTMAAYQTPLTTISYTATASNDTFTYSGTPLQIGDSVVFTVSTGTGGIVNGTNYWVRTIGTGIFTVSASVNSTTGTPISLFDVTTDGTGTFSTVNIGQVNQYAQNTPGGTTYAIDSNGRAWVLNGNLLPVFLGNTTLTNASGRGISVWHGYIFVFRNSLIDYCPTGTTAAWNYGWQTLASNNASFTGSHQTIITPSDVLYWCDGNVIGSLFQTFPGVTFDPTNAGTYTIAGVSPGTFALLLPLRDTMNCLAYTATNLVVGGTNNLIYSWDQISETYTSIIISENNIHQMVTTNTNIFIFAGSRGRIYVTNGAQADLYMKIPDHLSNTTEPNMAWGGVMFNRNQLYFGLTAFDPVSGTLIPQYGGVWAIDVSSGYGGSWVESQSSNTLRHVNILSYETYGGYMSAIVALKVTTTNSNISYDEWGFAAAWYDGVSVYGQDISFNVTGLATPYSNFETYFISDAVPVGTLQVPKTFSQIEWRTSVPLGSANDSVRLSYRINQLTGDASTWTVIGATTGANAGTISDVYPVNFQYAQYVQIKCEQKSATSSPTYVPIRELRLR